MQYNFDKIIDRKGTNAVKTDKCKEIFGREDLIPLWVADMDFATPDFITNAIIERCQHPVFGYTMPCPDFFNIIVDWIRKRHQWETKNNWIGFLPGIVPGIAFAINVFTQPHDEVIVQPPIYPPFIHLPTLNKRKVVYNPLKKVNGIFEMDFDDLVQKISPKTKLFLLCNPHNPGGRAWDKKTLLKLADICHKHNILVISDEIHADMALTGYRHTPFASISKQAEQNSITYIAPSKTFNMAGLISSSYIIPNPNIRERFTLFLQKIAAQHGNIFAYTATQAAYQYGEQWLSQMLAYIEENVKFVTDYLATNIPTIKPMIPQTSFLMWLDCTALGLDSESLQHFMVNKAKVGMNQGTTFGQGGEQHLRLNIGCPKALLRDALERIKNELNNL